MIPGLRILVAANPRTAGTAASTQISVSDEVKSASEPKKRRSPADDATANKDDQRKTKRVRTYPDGASVIETSAGGKTLHSGSAISQGAEPDLPGAVPEWAQSPGGRYGSGSGHLQRLLDIDVDCLVQDLEQL